jgi:hypothetical protein
MNISTHPKNLMADRFHLNDAFYCKLTMESISDDDCLRAQNT